MKNYNNLSFDVFILKSIITTVLITFLAII